MKFLTDINCVHCFHFLNFAFILCLFYIYFLLILCLFYVYFFRYLIHSMEFRSMILETLSDKIENEYLASHPNPADRKDGYGVLLKICCIRYRMFFFLIIYFCFVLFYSLSFLLPSFLLSFLPSYLFPLFLFAASFLPLHSFLPSPILTSHLLTPILFLYLFTDYRPISLFLNPLQSFIYPLSSLLSPFHSLLFTFYFSCPQRDLKGVGLGHITAKSKLLIQKSLEVATGEKHFNFLYFFFHNDSFSSGLLP